MWSCNNYFVLGVLDMDFSDLFFWDWTIKSKQNPSFWGLIIILKVYMSFHKCFRISENRFQYVDWFIIVFPHNYFMIRFRKSLHKSDQALLFPSFNYHKLFRFGIESFVNLIILRLIEYGFERVAKTLALWIFISKVDHWKEDNKAHENKKDTLQHCSECDTFWIRTFPHPFFLLNLTYYTFSFSCEITELNRWIKNKFTEIRSLNFLNLEKHWNNHVFSTIQHRNRKKIEKT